MSKKYIVNEQIQSNIVKLILDNGELHGNILTVEALKLAQDINLDLVEISKAMDGEISLCKLMDYGKLKYKSTKKHKNKNRDKTKEIRVSINISKNDLQTKHKKIKKLLSKKIKVKYVLELRGRQSNMIEEGRDIMMSNLEDFLGLAKWQQPETHRSRFFTYFSTILFFC